MSYSLEGLRKGYWDSKSSVSGIDDENLAELGYTPEEIAKIKGGK